MGRYFYPSAPDALSAKKMFLREHGYRIPHCFRNTWGSGFVLFDSKADVNSWYKEHTGEPFYKEEYEPGTVFTKQDAYREIDGSYGSQIEEVLRQRDFSLSTLAMGLPSTFGNRMFFQFVRSSDEADIERKFYIHYDAFILDANCGVSNSSLRDQVKTIIYKSFYNSRFKKRIEGSAQELERKESARRAATSERERIEKERIREQQRLEQERIRKQREQQEAIERDRIYRNALAKYQADMQVYEREVRYYNEAMTLKRQFSYGGQFPNGAGFICFLILLGLIFLSMFLTMLDGALPHGVLILIDLVVLIGGYRLIFKKLKPYLAEEHFDEESFSNWMRNNPNSPLIKYVCNPWRPSKPTPPIR